MLADGLQRAGRSQGATGVSRVVVRHSRVGMSDSL